MFKETIQPRFSETDALGHINNTILPIWFEKAREPIFRFFTPDLDPKKWELIIARIEVDFKAEILLTGDVEIQTWLDKIGSSSMGVVQQAVQNGTVCAIGKAALIHYDWQAKKPSPISDDIRALLSPHLIES
ncbi:acyl-CoA thioesterase [Bermanella sp. R86510]|uniref:acyl-CoA thioesterase n=1 Tax=unclassified Bermanella TaxID=2627862 RepID=UPI0037C69EC3